MGAPRLVYLARDARRRERYVTALEDEGFDVVEGRPADGQALVEQVRPDGTVLDLPEVEESDVELIAWLRNARPWRDRPCFVSNVPPRVRSDLDKAVPGLDFVKGRLVESVVDTYQQDAIEVAQRPSPEEMGDVLVV